MMAKRKKAEQSERSALDATVEEVLKETEASPKKAPGGNRSKKKTAEEKPPAIDQSLLIIPDEKKEKKKNGQAKNGSLTAKKDTGDTSQESKLPTVSGTRAVSRSTVPLSLPVLEKKNLLKTVLVIVLLALILTFSVWFLGVRPAAYTERTHSANFFYDAQNDQTVVTFDGTPAKTRLPGALRASAYDGAGKLCVALVADRLYLIEGAGKKDVTEIAAGVQDFVLASGGNALAYRTNENVLFYDWLGDKNAPMQIAPAVCDPRYALSPGGKELFYTYVDQASGSLRADVHSATDSKPAMQRSVDLYPIAVADKCKYLYFTNAEGELFVIYGKNGEMRSCGKEVKLDTLVFNCDFTQVTFQNGTETLFFVNGERVLVPEVGKTETLQMLPNQRMAIRPLQTGSQYLCGSLLDQYYLHNTGENGTQLVFLKYKKMKDRVVKKFVSNVDGAAAVTVTDKAVYFLSTSVEASETHTKLFLCKPGKTQAKLVAWDVAEVCANVDGSCILYTDLHGALYAKRLRANSKRLCDSVVPDSLRVTGHDIFYFYTAEGVLATSDNGDALRVISEGVSSFFVDAKTVYFVTSNEQGSAVHAIHRGRRKIQTIAI